MQLHLSEYLRIASLKPVIRLAAMAAIFETVLMATLFSAATLSYGQSFDRSSLFFILALALYVMTVRKFKKGLHVVFEERIAEIRLRIMDRVRNTDLLSLEDIGVEPIYTALTFDLKSVSEISYTITATVYAVFLLIGILIYLTVLSQYAFFITVVVGCIAGAFYGYNQFLIKQIISHVREQEKNMFEAVKHLLDGFKELRLNDKKSDDFFHHGLKQYITHLQQLKLQATQHFIDNYSLTYVLWKALIIVPVLILPVVGVFSQNILITFIGIILFMPINYLVEEIPRIILASISIQRLYRLEHALEALAQEPLEIISEPEQVEFEELTYNNITFHYEESGGRPFSIGPLSISVQVGEIVFITGGNGSGKTTLLKLITGLYPTDSGHVYLNNKEIHISQHRYLFSAVFTDFHLFDRLYGLSDIDEPKVHELLKLMQFDQKVQFTDNQFSTLDLSTGQKKRLALIAAIMEDKPIYIFDEWAADQDPYFREYFYLNLLPTFKAQGKTVIAVTHDDKYFHAADRIMKMEYGKFVNP
jgi:putative ATP-binding cassette transporter